ncbi:MAG: DUF115 domain-containing protein [Microscillaceae bacterium]|nr:DUF115 domain-containing protein [Microscillaceae bacterium]
MDLKREFLTLRFALGQYLQDRKSADYRKFIEWYYKNQKTNPEAVKNLFYILHLHKSRAEWFSREGFRLNEFKNIHSGQSCFIIGNGPSLNKMDLNPLNSYYTFGLNKIFLIFERVALHLSYHVAVNPFVIEQSKAEIEQLKCPSFLSFNGAKDVIHPKSHIYTIWTGSTPLEFSTDILVGLSEGFTVTYVAMQIAYFMGFEKVFLIGVDHNFNQKGKPNETQLLQGEDPNHFDSRYFAGKKWQLADLEGSELAYQSAKFHFSRQGRIIYDATVDGKLQVFPKISFEEALKMAKPKNL